MVRRLESCKCKNVKVYFRIFPMEKMCWEHVKILDDKKTLYVRCLQDFEIGREMLTPSYWIFETDGVFYNHTQAEIYEAIIPNLLEIITNGQNAIILSFGQTGTGKSVTLSGIENSYEDRGIIPRLVSQLFAIKTELKNKVKLCFKLSYIEASKMYIRDLLKEVETVFDMNSMKGISTAQIQTEEEMLKTIFKAEGRKTLIKDAQYISHAANTVLTISIISRQINNSNMMKTYSKIHIVDLAGADTVGNETCLFKSSFDIGTANLAKTQLELFILVLIENIPEHIAVTQRLNILIQYLKDSLNSNSLLRFIGHIRTKQENLMITLSMLRFSQTVRGLKINKQPVENYEDQETKIKHLEVELNDIKREQEIRSMIKNEDLKTNVTGERIAQMRNLAEDYLRNRTNELAIISVSDMTTALQVFKTMYQQLEDEKTTELEGIYKKAYDDALLSLKTGGRRDSAVSQRSSRRGSIKSRDTAGMSARQLKTSSKQLPKTTSSKGSSKSDEKESYLDRQSASISNKFKPNVSNDTMSIEKSLKKTRSTSSKMLKKVNSSRRKSSLSSDIQVKDKILDEDLPLPEVIPAHSDAWQAFITDENVQFNELKAEMDEYESRGKELNLNYLDEVRKLQDLRNFSDNCKEKLIRARMQKELDGYGQQTDDYGQVIFSEEEQICKAMLDNSEKQVLKQQEKVLALQAELNLYLQLYQDKKRFIGESFEIFCTSKYKTLVPNLSISLHEVELEVSSAKDIEERKDSEEKIVAEQKITKQHQTQFVQYENLKALMYRQRDKMEQAQISNRKWIRSCKK